MRSTAILFGDADRVIIGIIQGLLLLTLWIIGSKVELGIYYNLGLLAAAGLAVYQQHLIRDRDVRGCLQAFLNNHWFGVVIFVGLVLDYWTKY